MPRRQRPVTLGPIRLYHDQEPDHQLIDWLRQFDAQPYGVKSRAVKEALARGIGIDGGCPGQPGALPDREKLREVVVEALDLGEIQARLDTVEELVSPPTSPSPEGGTEGASAFLRADLRRLLGGLYDVERLVGRIGFPSELYPIIIWATHRPFFSEK